VWVQQHEYKVVGTALERARRRAGLSQQELAQRLSKPQSFVSNYESGQRRVDVLELLLIAAAIDANAGKLLTEIKLHFASKTQRKKL